ncbi:Metalloprotease [Xylariomycetidae sp. FL2044]|nr:Metalloprotease [Xylariomycetidae sp. FL2044]
MPYNNSTTPNATDPGLCLTPECVFWSGRILRNLHPQYQHIDPCVDFNQYACGGYPFPSPTDTEVIVSMQRENTEYMRRILNSPFPATEDSTPDDEYVFNLIAGDFNACMDTAAINASALTLGGIPEMIAQVDTLFPVRETDWMANKTISEDDYGSLANVVAYMASIGVPAFGDWSTVVDSQNPEDTIPAFALTSPFRIDMTLPPALNYTVMATSETVESITKQLQLVLSSPAAQNATSRVSREILDLLKAFALIEMQTITASPLASWDTTSIAEASAGAPALVLDKVIKLLAPNGYNADRMVLSYKEFYPAASELVSELSPATVQAFLKYRVLQTYSAYLDGSDGATGDRFAVCYVHAGASLPWAYGKFFLDAKYSREKLESVTSIAEADREAFLKRVDAADWLDEESRKLVKTKINDLIANIGYNGDDPDAWNATSLRQWYEGVNITDSFFSNALSIRKWAAGKSWSSLLEPVNRHQWHFANVQPWIVNARAVREKGFIMVPAGAQQQGWFDLNVPKYLQYGSLGYIIAHELAHHLDDLGSQWDEGMRLREWWPEQTRAAFDERAQCVVDHYAQIPVRLPDNTALLVDPATNATLHVNGTLTLSENIADISGLNVAFDAWRSAERRSLPDPGMPGLPGFTKEQLFFLAFGQTWCSDYSEEYLRATVAQEVHSPSPARILGGVANSAAFKEAFQCADRRPACEIW